MLYSAMEKLSKPESLTGRPLILNTVAKGVMKAVSPTTRRMDRHRVRANEIIKSRKSK